MAWMVVVEEMGRVPKRPVGDLMLQLVLSALSLVWPAFDVFVGNCEEGKRRLVGQGRMLVPYRGRVHPHPAPPGLTCSRSHDLRDPWLSQPKAPLPPSLVFPSTPL